MQDIDRTSRIGRRRAFTLAESLIATVVLAIASVGVLETLAASARQSQAFDFEAAETAMARSLLEQIAARNFDPPTSNDHPGYSLANLNDENFDNVGDFADYTDTVAADDVDESGATLRTIQFVRVVSVQFRQTPDGAGSNLRTAATPFAMVTIVVSPPAEMGAGPITLCRLMTRYTRG